MDRTIVYPGSIPLDTDLLSTNRNVMTALGALTAATIGPGPAVDGLVVTPAVTGLAVVVGAGSFVMSAPLDQSGYGSLPANANDSIAKMGVNVAPLTITLAAPTAAGTVISYLIQATFQEQDVNPIVLPYYNAANPTQPFMGAANNGLAQPTLRSQRVAIQAKAGAAGTPGANQNPAPDAGWVGLAMVTVANGQNTVVSSNIVAYVPTRFLTFKIGDLRPGTSRWSIFTTSGNFVVPNGVLRLKVKVLGGGGGAGMHATSPGGGGGAGGMARGWIYNLAAGTSVPVTVGVGGAAPSSPGNGGPGGTSSFGTFMSATGGQGGFGGNTPNLVMAGGQGGSGSGGDYQASGSCGTDAIPIAARGGDGGGPGNGRGTSGLVVGVPGAAPGAGGGGGGASAATGAGVGAQGGVGASGIVVVEY